MITNPFRRRRVPAHNTFTDIGGLQRLGAPSPTQTLSMEVAQGPFYEMVPGDLFNPGTMNWVLLPPWETPLNTTWGHGFAIDQPATSQILQHHLVYSQPHVLPFFFRGMPSNQMLVPNSLAMDIGTGDIVPNPLDPTTGMPALSADATDTSAGIAWGYTGDDTGSTAPLSDWAG